MNLSFCCRGTPRGMMGWRSGRTLRLPPILASCSSGRVQGSWQRWDAGYGTAMRALTHQWHAMIQQSCLQRLPVGMTLWSLGWWFPCGNHSRTPAVRPCGLHSGNMQAAHTQDSACRGVCRCLKCCPDPEETALLWCSRRGTRHWRRMSRCGTRMPSTTSFDSILRSTALAPS